MLFFLLSCAGSVEPEQIAQKETLEEVSQVPSLRQLTLAEYNNTLQDIFVGYEIPTISWLTAEVDGLYDRNVEIYQANPTLVEGLQEGSMRVAEALLAQEYFEVCSDIICGQSFLLDLAKTIWRRPLTGEEVDQITENLVIWSEETSLYLSMAMTVQYLLQSPHFLYFPEFGEDEILLSDWEIASRMSYLLWSTMPDQELFDLAEQGKLQDAQIVTEQAWRMFEDPKIKQGLLQFHRQWLKLDQINQRTIDLSLVNFFPSDELNAEYVHQLLQPQMRQQLDLFLLYHILEGTGDLSDLLNSSRYYVTEHLAPLYGMEIPVSAVGKEYQSVISSATTVQEDEPSEYSAIYYPIDLSALDQRAGILTHIGWLHSTSTLNHPSPVHRGLFVLQNLLCQEINDPPNEILSVEENEEPQTNRERYAQHSTNPSCASCHDRIDGIGFSFEHYDILGRYQTEDNGIPINANGELLQTDVDGEFEHALPLIQALSNSQMVHDCVTQEWLRYALARQLTDKDQESLDLLSDQFWNAGGHIPSLLVSITTSPLFFPRSIP